MTTETQKASEARSEAQDEEQSILPTVLAGAGILAVAALLIFWPSDDSSSREGAGAGNNGVANGARDGGGRGPGGRAAGVGSRPSDAATAPEGRRNPNIKLPTAGRGMAPVPEPQPKDPPPTASVDDKIAFYEGRLEQAIRLRDNRKKFADRLPNVKARIEASDNPEEGMKTFEKRKQIVEDNFAKAQADVEEIEGKLAELRG